MKGAFSYSYKCLLVLFFWALLEVIEHNRPQDLVGSNLPQQPRQHLKRALMARAPSSSPCSTHQNRVVHRHAD